MLKFFDVLDDFHMEFELVSLSYSIIRILEVTEMFVSDFPQIKLKATFVKDM